MSELSEQTTPSGRLLELERASRKDLEALFVRGKRPALDDLGGWEFRGVNTPAWAARVGIKKFCKGFYWNDSQLRGYNTPVEQNALGESWVVKPNEDKPKRFGFYLVSPVDAASRDNAYLNAVLLDYGRGDNRRFDPTRGLRDYLVELDGEDRTLYLGKAFYAVGPVRVPASFFLLERWKKGIDRL
jgi:hypothetical protein